MKGPIALLRESVDMFMSNPKLYIGIYLIPGILSFLLTFITQDDFEAATGGIIALATVLTIVMIVVSIFMSIAMTKAVINPTLSIKEAYVSAKPLFWQYLLLSIMVSLVTLAGFILLVIPGIIFMVWFSFSYYVYIVEGISGIDAMKRSKALVAGKWWAVFGRLAALVLFAITIGMAAGILGEIIGSMGGEIIVAIVSVLANAVLVPISIAYLYLIYKELAPGARTVSSEPVAQTM